MDVVNQLTDEYATEHNVQNAPHRESTRPPPGTLNACSRDLDHVALWVADRDAIADFAVIASRHARDRAHRPLHAHRRGRPPRQAHALRRGGPARREVHSKDVALRVSILTRRAQARPTGRRGVRVGEGLRIRLVEAPDRGRLRPRPRRAVLGRPRGDRARVPRARLRRGRAGATVFRASSSAARFSSSTPGDPSEPERPLLNHLAVLVDPTRRREGAARRGRRRRRRAEHVRRVRWGPERVKIEYVEHKPTFSLV